jgi:uncharacterized membrane protein YukC
VTIENSTRNAKCWAYFDRLGRFTLPQSKNIRDNLEDNTMQQLSFANLVEHVQHLPLDEKQELWELLENYLREERRNRIYQAYQEAREAENSLTFSSDINELKGRLG